jgi:multiple sugar transport system permease protein
MRRLTTQTSVPGPGAMARAPAPGFWRWLGLHRSEARAGYLFVAPGTLFILVFVVVPMVAGLALSLFRWDMLTPPLFAALENFRVLVDDSLFLAALRNTFYFACVSGPISVALGLAFAIVINERWIRGKTAFSTIYFIPVVMSMVAAALIWRWIYDSQFGLLNALLKLVGLPAQMWLVDPQWAVPAMMAVSIWKTVGYNLVIYLAGLQGVPGELYEAAEIDGASRIRQLRHITLPLLRPTTLFVTVMAIIQSFQTLDLVYVFVGERGPDRNSILAVYDIYLTAFRSYRLGYASAKAVVLFLVIMVFTALLIKLFSDQTEY